MADKRPKRKLSLPRLILLICLIGFVIAVGTGTGLVIAAIASMPDWDPNDVQASQVSTLLYDDKDQKFADLHAEEHRIVVNDFNKIPDYLKKAFIATEDNQFMTHNGINFKSIARAAFANITEGYGTQGGSTITQQLVKNAFLTSEKTLIRKIQEAILAMKIERRYSKEEIFKYYLNYIYFGHGVNGVEAAAQLYFGKHVENLTLPESALIAGLVKAPSRYSPYNNMEAAIERRAKVLNDMVRNGFISEAEAEKAKKSEIKLVGLKKTSENYSYFVDYIVDQAVEKYNIEARDLYTGGYKIYTTLNQDIQKAIDEAYKDEKNFPKGKDGKIVESAMVVIDHQSGAIKGLIGGRDYSQQRGFNRAVQAYRQPGSTIKPIAVYAPALEKGYGPATVLDDVPTTFGKEGWTPENYDGKYRGLISMRTAIQYSVNVYAVKMLELIGASEGANFARKLGITKNVQGSYLSLALGTNNATPLQMAAAYGSFANEGIYIEPFAIRKIVDRNGNVVGETKAKKSVVMSPQTAFLLTDMLQAVVQSGTGASARLNRPVAGKTGTSQFDVDAWFVGYTPELVASVWMGYDKEESMTKIYGGSYPARVWKYVMNKALSKVPVKPFPRPDGITSVVVDTKSGLLPSELTPEEFIAPELFNAKHVPTEVSTVWEQAQICSVSGQLFGPYCPEPSITGVFLRRPVPYTGSKKPLDANLEKPTEVCTVHNPDGSVINPGNSSPGNNGNTNNGEIFPPVNNSNIGNNGNDMPSNVPPASPTNVKGYVEKTPSGQLSVKLNWQAKSKGKIGYYIYRGEKPGFLPTPQTRVSPLIFSKNWVDDTVESGQDYYYLVVAVDTVSNLQSAPSAPLVITTPETN